MERTRMGACAAMTHLGIAATAWRERSCWRSRTIGNTMAHWSPFPGLGSGHHFGGREFAEGRKGAIVQSRLGSTPEKTYP